MNIDFNRQVLIRVFVHFLIMVFVAKSASMGVSYFLPSSGIQNLQKAQVTMPYMRYVANGFGLKASKMNVIESANALTIDSIILKAIYMMGEESIVVVAAKKNPSKSKSILMGENFQGYKLDKVFTQYALFVRNSKQYRLYLNKPKPNTRWKSIDRSDVSEEKELVRRISSSEVKKAISNPTNIWKNIGLRGHFTAGKQDGFKVTFVRKGTTFEALGLKLGDIIETVNNKELKSNAQALSAYEELKDAKALKLTIIRAKTRMELEYEIF